MSEQVQQEGTFKIKRKPKQLVKDDIIKVDLSKKQEEPKKETDAIQVGKTEEVVVGKQTGDSPKVDERVPEPGPISEVKEEKVKPIEEVVEKEIQQIGEKLEQKVIAPTPEEAREVAQLPENIEKVVDFMKETGGTLEDYVRLNADYTSVADDVLLREYYLKTKPYLENDDVDLLLEDYSYDEDLDEDIDIRKKKLALKEEVAKAKGFLEETKSKYYDEIKLRPGVTQDQKKATDFFNRYQEDQSKAVEKQDQFKSATKELFNDDFKGFDFEVGEKKFRYGLQNKDAVAEKQSDINNFVKKFLDDKGNVINHEGYHKALYAAMNSDKLANHFYEQGKADAVRDVISSSKNPSTSPRPTSDGNVFINGFKVKAISGMDSTKLKIKTKKFN